MCTSNAVRHLWCPADELGTSLRLAEQGWTPLHSAVASGRESVAAYLLSLGAAVDAKTSGKRTALHYAASKGHIALIRLLLKHGAAVNVRDDTGSTPLHRAASADKGEAVRVLVEEGAAALGAQDACGCTPLFVAAQCDSGAIALYLASRGAAVDVLNSSKQTALDVASDKLRRELLRLTQVDEDMEMNGS